MALIPLRPYIHWLALVGRGREGRKSINKVLGVAESIRRLHSIVKARSIDRSAAYHKSKEADRVREEGLRLH